MTKATANERGAGRSPAPPSIDAKDTAEPLKAATSGACAISGKRSRWYAFQREISLRTRSEVVAAGTWRDYGWARTGVLMDLLN